MWKNGRTMTRPPYPIAIVAEDAPARYLEVGDRTPGDEGTYPDDDIQARLVDGEWKFTRKDGSPF